MIDQDTKILVTRAGDREGADKLLDHIEMKVKLNPDCWHILLELMENDEYLCHVAKKIKGEIIPVTSYDILNIIIIL